MPEPPKPFEAAADAQRQLLEASVDLVEKATLAPERAARASEVEVGTTPSETVYEENKLELLRYEPVVSEDERKETPILVVYALVNKPYILDLQPDRSVVRRLLEGGYDVYMIDWGEPSVLDQHLTLDDYINRYIENCVEEVREDAGVEEVNVFGYCMGGTMSAAYTALNPENVGSLVLMASGLCFDGNGGLLELWGSGEYYDPQDLADAFGNAPGEALDLTYILMEPTSNTVSKYLGLYENVEDEDFVENFARMEKWLGDSVDVAGAAYTEFVEKVYQENQLYENEMRVGGEGVDVEEIDVPVLQIVGEYDHLVPPEASVPFNDVVGSDDTDVFEFPVGHVGLSVSSSSHEKLWPRVCEWLDEREKERKKEETESEGEPTATTEEAVGEEAETETAEAEVKGEGKETAAEGEAETGTQEKESGDGAAALKGVSGVGPTYAGRLRDAGIEDAADLSEADPDNVAEAAEVSVERARGWIESAED